jgi:predicted negative regulator of RcsB-dependent stress response
MLGDLLVALGNSDEARQSYQKARVSALASSSRS